MTSDESSILEYLSKPVLPLPSVYVPDILLFKTPTNGLLAPAEHLFVDHVARLRLQSHKPIGHGRVASASRSLPNTNASCQLLAIRQRS